VTTMPNCHQIESLVTPYVDGDVSPTDRDVVDGHLRECPQCLSRIRSEQTVHDLLRERRAVLEAGCAPPRLRARCSSLGDSLEPVAGWISTWRPRIVPALLAASLVVIVGGAFLYELTERSTRVMAMELTADHVKCFRLINNILGTRNEPGAVESSMASRFAWQMRLPEHPEQAGLELIGARPCLYAEGLAAHIMYRHNGEPVSVFMLPKKTRSEEQIEVLGHQAAIWSTDDRTFVLIAREPRAEVERMTAFVHSALR
jgi:anti-sigma factor RsiW